MSLARRWLVTAVWTAVLVIADIDSPYCASRYRRLCQGKGRHVACQFPSPGPGPSCVNYTAVNFGKELRHFIVHYINRRRQRIASGNERVRGGVHLPRPEIMMQVEWDRELATLAQRLADQCSFVHDDCRATGLNTITSHNVPTEGHDSTLIRYPYAGQTVGEVKWKRSSESDQQNAARAIRRVLDAWWGERRRVTVRQLTRPFRLSSKGTVWGHFSQLAVWSLRGVGCGAVRYGAPYPKILLVCDFSHTNMLGQRTLSPGPIAACPIHTIRRQRSIYPLLCSPVRHPILQDQDSLNQSENPSQDYDVQSYDTNYDDTDHLYDDLFVSLGSSTAANSTYFSRQRGKGYEKARNSGRQFFLQKARARDEENAETERLYEQRGQRQRNQYHEDRFEKEREQIPVGDISDDIGIDEKDEIRNKEKMVMRDRNHRRGDFRVEERSERERERKPERERTYNMPDPEIDPTRIDTNPLLDKPYGGRTLETARNVEREEILHRGRFQNKETNLEREDTRRIPLREGGYEGDKPSNRETIRKKQDIEDRSSRFYKISDRRLQSDMILRERPTNIERDRARISQRLDDNNSEKQKYRVEARAIPSLSNMANALKQSDKPWIPPTGEYFVRETTRGSSYVELHRKDWTSVDPTRSSQFIPFEDKMRETTSKIAMVFYEPVKHRWRPTRDRPNRPGAKALLLNTAASGQGSSHKFATSKPVIGFLKMDQDDAEQLFKDTGYNPLWKINKKIPTTTSQT